MLNIIIDLDDDISSYSMGYMVFEGDKKTINSKELEPPQQMMVFFSIVEILDGLRKFCLSDKVKKYEFIGVDSSFAICFEKIEKNTVKVSHQKVEISNMSMTDLIKSILNNIKYFSDNVCSKIDRDELIYEDLIGSIKEFQAIE
ncbi:MAG: hypothetical protein ACRBBR_13775 [Cellvibrionaceae bacterium]